MAPDLLPPGDSTGGEIADAICRTLETAILEQALLPGAKLSEDVIGGHFGVSRTVVRTALNRLAADSLVEFKRNRGAFVAAPSVEEARAVFDARRALELAVVERAVETARPRDLEQLRRLAAHERAVHAGHDAIEKHRLSGNFHLDLAAIAGNPVLASLLAKLISRCALVIALYGRKDASRCGAADHLALIDALAAGDRAAALACMGEHLDRIEADLRLAPEASDSASLERILARFRR